MDEEQTELSVELLGKGYRVVEVARILGISDADVDAVAKQYKREIQTARIESTVTSRAMDDDIEEAEKRALERLHSQLAIETDTAKLTRAFVALNSAKRRSPPTEETGTGRDSLAHVRLPAHLRQNVTFVQNNHNQIIQVNGQELSTASNKRVSEFLKRKHENKSLSLGGDSHELSAADFDKETEKS